MMEYLALLWNLAALIVGSNCVKGLIVKIFFQKIKVEGDWSKLEVKNCFQRQPQAKYLREALVFM